MADEGPTEVVRTVMWPEGIVTKTEHSDERWPREHMTIYTHPLRWPFGDCGCQASSGRKATVDDVIAWWESHCTERRHFRRSSPLLPVGLMAIA